MSGKHWLMGVGAGVSVGCLVFVGCGGTTITATPTDAGNDVTAPTDATPPRDTSVPDAPPVRDAAPPACVNDADLTTSVIEDASIGDAGGSTGRCLTCARSKCSSEVNACNQECECRQLISELFVCLSQGDLFTCGSGIATNNSSTNAQPLGICILGGCQAECGINFGTDAGPRDASGDGG